MYELPLMGHTLVAYCWEVFLFAAFRICGPVLQTQIELEG